MKTNRWLLLAAAVLMLAGFCAAQSVDAYLGMGTLLTSAGPSGVPKLGGGAYLNAGGDVIFLPHNLGVGAQVQWRASQTDYFGVGERPVLYTFNLVWEPIPMGASIRPDISVGIGAENLRFYSGTFTCGSFTGCTNHTSSNHFTLHAGIGVKIYWGGHLFLRPAVDYYHIDSNTEFGVNSAWQAGLSLGYSLGPTS
ncbi:MAG: outer membrane beta-barrel protein [Terriglobales bacterium]